GLQVRAPVARPRRQDDVLAFLPNKHLSGGELVLLGEPDGLAAVGHENLGDAWHGSGPSWCPLCHIRYVHGTACALRASTRAFVRIQRIVRKPGSAKFFVFNTQQWSESHPLRNPSIFVFNHLSGGVGSLRAMRLSFAT